MALSKEHIKFIDDYLKEQEVVFWDVRLELIDHVASKLEENQDLVLNRTFLIREFGTRISLDKLVDDKEKLIRKKYRRLYLKELISLVKSPLKIFLLMLFIFGYYFVLSEFSTVIFKYTSWVIFFLPVLIFIISPAFVFNKKNKSVHVEDATFLIFPSILLLQFIRIKIDSSFNYKLIIYVLVSLNAIWYFIGIKTYIKVYKKYTKIFKQLQAL